MTDAEEIHSTQISIQSDCLDKSLQKQGIYDVKFTAVLEERNFNIINNFSLATPQHNNVIY